MFVDVRYYELWRYITTQVSDLDFEVELIA